jgi:peptide/nickel transport system substrate-binding protein
MNFRKIFAAALTVATALSLTACSSTSSATTASATSAAKTDTMNIELTTAPVGLHPLKTNDAASTFVTGQIFETLYRRTVDGTSYEPLLAESLPEFSADGLTATIHLRKNVKFQDGTAFTADAVAYMIDCLKDTKYGSQRPSIVESISSYTVVDDNTIQLHLAYEDGVLVAKLAHTNGAIVNPALDKSKDLLVDPTGAGTGPYSYVSSTSGSKYTLAANTSYWGGTPAIANVVYDVVADEATAVARIQTGEADLYPTVSSDSYSTVSAVNGYTAVSESSSAIYYMAYRSTAATSSNQLMANKDFRKALIEAVDFEAYTKSVVGDNATFEKSILGPTLVGYTSEMDSAYVGYNLDDAKKIVEANGWTGQTVTMLTSTREWHKTVAAYVQDQLSKIGITVNVVSEEWATYLSDAKKDGNFDFCILSWSNVTGDGQQMLEPNFSTKNGTRIKYNNAAFDAAVDASAKTSVLADRQKYMLEAVKMIQGDCVVAPMYSANTTYVYNSTKFTGVVFDKGGQFTVSDFKTK